MREIPRLTEPSPAWIAARWVVLFVTVGLIAGFWLAPDASLSVLWYVLIPILPATFLLNVSLWRNVCPLATLNVLGGSIAGSRALSKSAVKVAGLVGVILLAVMVPARRFLFNVDATALGVTVIAVCVLAIVGGLLFQMKAGFCNALCPVLPVERLYGQRPLIVVPNARCLTCAACSQGCLDLAPRDSALARVGRKNGPPKRPWQLTTFGVFALAFPGFVLSYYLIDDGTLAEAVVVYGTMGAWSIGSWILLAGGFAALRIDVGPALLICAALAVGIYYWFAPPGIAAEFGLPASFAWSMRVLTLGLVAVWLAKGLATRSARAARRVA